MSIKEITYTEAEWWLLNYWDKFEEKLSQYYKKEIVALFCKETKSIFFADKKTLKPIRTLLYKK